MTDPQAFGLLSMLLYECSGYLYLLESPVQAMKTFGSCGMIPDFIGEVYD
jgi:hypothetical protein